MVSLQEKTASPSTVDIEGRTFAIPEVANFMAQLKTDEYISEVNLSNIEQIDDKDKVFRFRVVCTINPDAGL